MRLPSAVLNSLPHPGVPLAGPRSRLGGRARALVAVLAALAAGGCSWFGQKTRPQPLSEAARRQLAVECRAAMERAGGAGVWIKRLPAGESPGDVLATPLAYERASAALRARATRRHFLVRVREIRSAAEHRETEFILERGGQTAGRWRLRETPRLLRAAIIIDDLGNDPGAERRLLALRYPLTLAVLPELPHSASTAQAAHRGGREVLLHLPMEPLPGAESQPGPGEIKVGMSARQVDRLISADLASVPFAVGVNNHMGSRATADPALMAEVMRVLAARGLFFVDSRTTAQTCALAAARRAGVPAFYRSVFLDDTESVAYSLGQLKQFRRVVEEQGTAIAIGHPHPTTLRALAEFLPTLEGDDIRLVPASQLVRSPEAARLTPHAAHSR